MIKCSKCDKEFKKKRLLRLHFARQHIDPSEWTAKCEICEKKFADNEILSRHLKTHQPKNVACQDTKCQTIFGTRSAMLAHYRRFHFDKKSSSGDVTQENVNNKKLYSCDTCDKTFKKHHRLKEHTYEHTGVLPFECTICEKRFKSLAHRTRHEKVHAGYKCTTCLMVLPNWKDLCAHKKQMHGKQYKCGQCELEFKSKYALSQHVSVKHAEEREVFACDKCDNTYTRKSYLLKHWRIVHENKRDHQCLHCDKKFAHKHTLIKHEKTHEPGYVRPATKPKRANNKQKSLPEHLAIINKLTGLTPIIAT